MVPPSRPPLSPASPPSGFLEMRREHPGQNGPLAAVERDEALDLVSELPHVPRPAIPDERPNGRGSDRRRADAGAPRAAREKEARERQHVLLAGAQGRNVQPHSGDSVIEVLPESSLPREIEEIAVRREYEAHVHRPAPALPEAPDLLLLEHAQERRLKRERHLPDLVEKEGPAARALDEPGPLPARPGEGSLRVPEELALEERVGQLHRARDDERLRAPPAQGMNVARDDLLPRPALAFYKEGDVARGDGPDRALELDHGNRFPDERRVESRGRAAFVIRSAPGKLSAVEQRFEQIEKRRGLRDAIAGESLAGPAEHEIDLDIEAVRRALQLPLTRIGHSRSEIGERELRAVPAADPVIGAARRNARRSSPPAFSDRERAPPVPRRPPRRACAPARPRTPRTLY